MSFKVSKNIKLMVEEKALPGVKRIAGYVASDMEKVFGSAPSFESDADFTGTISVDENMIIASTVGYSDFLSSIDTKAIEGKREVYMFTLYNGALVIAGSDKRGTIYGLFMLSELLGVSPFVNWGDVKPVHRDEVVLEDKDMIVSKEPSVRFRGFFINDEWPAFGNWSETRFGGFNAKCYERVFELLLRLKGNYLWPAMWSAQFNLDGPGIENARLADEMGVVMGMSHHEPCCRNGEEYKYVRGPKSIYGDDWNFVRNREGITKFWEDGLKRNAAFENVITVGMRGEADSTILGHEATLKDNIDYLRDVLKTQEGLIKKFVNEDITKVPRMLALYKEVEPFFYGDENTPGLMDSPDLEGVTLMLCDDNFGDLRTIPTEHMRSHNGGYGMYYHFDYHGSPISYEWSNSTYIPKVWNQMTTAYDNGIQELWIVNVGDIFTTEFPLGFFLDLAYDFDKWGTTNPDAPEQYTNKFINQNFPKFNDMQKEVTYEILEGYTRISQRRRPEATNTTNIIANKQGDDLDALFRECNKLMMNCETMYKGCDALSSFPFFEFVYYPAMGNLNVLTMWMEAAFNQYLAVLSAVAANTISPIIMEKLDFDKELVEQLHTINGGFWYGMGMSEHIGFKHWNEEECAYPILHQVIPTNKPRIVVTVPGTFQHTEGGDWTRQTLKLYSDDECSLQLFTTSYKDSEFEVSVESPFISVDKEKGLITEGDMDFVKISVDSALRDLGSNSDADKIGKLMIKTFNGKIFVEVNPEYMNPVKTIYKDVLGTRSLSCTFDAYKEGEYEAKIFFNSNNPPFMDNKLLYSASINDGEEKEYNAVSEKFKVGDNQFEWYEGVLINTRIATVPFSATKGCNNLNVKAISQGLLIEKIVVERK